MKKWPRCPLADCQGPERGPMRYTKGVVWLSDEWRAPGRRTQSAADVEVAPRWQDLTLNGLKMMMFKKAQVPGRLQEVL